jgi:tetratricopeptide (TPR) repeat protein
VPAADWDKVKALFNAALDQPASERGAFVAHAAAGDASLREAVESLLASHDDDDDFLETPAAALRLSEFSESLPAGSRVGAYRLLREIGRGGMGTVHLAARDDGEFRHQVAVKLVSRGMDTDLILRRFRHERQILAGLDQPNIARLLDGGTTDDGRPFFVMEYIEGEPIDEYCKKRDLPLAERLKLFQLVCGAVQHAHQNLIVHRDIKASNILVTSTGVPKLLDFGIAKLLDPERDGAGTAAPLTMRALTPEYASPEQVRGDPITTASDVYSLGVLLYELLAGQRPYELRSRRHEDIVRAVCDTDPAPPSAVVTGEHADARRRHLRGDLDTIVLMAMRKDPQRRYRSADQLSEDLQRYLEGRPVGARRDTLAYRVAKFTRRNRAGVATAVVVLLSLIGGLATTMWEARVAQAQRARAERRFAEVRTLATSFLFELHDAIASLPGSTPARALLVRRALSSLDGLASEAQGDATLQRDLATAYERIGRVQGNSYNSNLGDTKGALESYRKSLAIRERLARENPQSLELQNELASGYHGMGDMLNTVGELTAALKSYEQSLAIRQALMVKQPDNAENRVDIAELYTSIGDTKGMDGYANLGDVAGALSSYRQSVQIREALLRSSPQSRDYRVGVANSLMNLGYMLGSVADTSGATQVRRAIDMFERIVAEDPNDAKRRVGLLSGYVRLRFVLADAGRLEEAIRVDRETVVELEQMLRSDSTNALLRRNLGATYNFLGRDLRSSRHADQAVQIHRKALGIAQSLATGDSTSSEHRHDVAFTHYLLAEALADTRDLRGALDEYGRAASAKETLRVSEPTNTRHGDDLGLIYTGMGNALVRAGDLTAAQSAFQEALSFLEAAVARSKSNQKGKASLALTYAGVGRLHSAMGSVAQSSANREAACRDADLWYQKSLDIWLEMRRSGRLLPVNAGRPAEMAALIAKCDSAMGK